MPPTLLFETNNAISAILFPLMAGILIAAFLVFFNKKTIGKFVKKLFDENATTVETAKTLRELGLEKKKVLKWALRPDSTLRKVVASTGGEDGTSERFYIPDEKAYRAEITYNPDGSSVMTLVIAVILFAVLTAILLAILPDLIQMAKSAFGSFFS